MFAIEDVPQLYKENIPVGEKVKFTAGSAGCQQLNREPDVHRTHKQHSMTLYAYQSYFQLRSEVSGQVQGHHKHEPNIYIYEEGRGKIGNFIPLLYTKMDNLNT